MSGARVPALAPPSPPQHERIAEVRARAAAIEARRAGAVEQRLHARDERKERRRVAAERESLVKGLLRACALGARARDWHARWDATVYGTARRPIGRARARARAASDEGPRG